MSKPNTDSHKKMVEQFEELIISTKESFYSQTPSILDQCKKLVPVVSNRSIDLTEQLSVPNFFRELFFKQNLTLNSFDSISECVRTLTRLKNNTNESNIIIENNQEIFLHKYSKSLIIFVILIICVSFISIIGNLCLAKVLYSKRYRLMQTDRIVLCLALSELCLVLIDSPTEIYRFLSPSFTQEWLCRFHTFFEVLFSSCIIFYHLLGAFDRFVYIHGHTFTNRSRWSKWCRRVSTKSCSIILLVLPIIFSLPLSICNCLYANIVQTTINSKTCIVQHAHRLLIVLFILFHIIPLLFAFFLHAKLIYFIRRRHRQYYFTTKTYILPLKRDAIVEFQSKRRPNQENSNSYDRLFLQPQISSNRRLIPSNTETHGSTTTTMAAIQPASLNVNNSSNSSQSSRSSTQKTSASVTSPIVLYKINSEANANANRTVLLLVLLLSFYVFCWAPYNIYTWYHAYQLTESFHLPYLMSMNNNSNLQMSISIRNNLNSYLRRFIYINYCLYLLSMISMCFSFIFYFSLNKQARREFSRFIGCICPWTIPKRNLKQRKQFRQFQYHGRFNNQSIYKNDRLPKSPSSLYYHRNDTSKRIIGNYGCQIQCCS